MLLPAQPAPETPPAAPAAPAIGRETLAISAPKDVSHLDCNVAKPDYPDLSRRRSESGTAVVYFVVGLTGRIEDIQLQKSSGYTRLDDAALDAMRGSACRPYLENGKPIRAAYSQPFAFSLTN
jgi:periplasmic protein TonB